MSEKFEKLLDLLVNEEKAKAEDLFHEIVVDKSREIYEELVSNDAETETIKEKKDEEVDETKEKEEVDEKKEEVDEKKEEVDEKKEDKEVDESKDKEVEETADEVEETIGGDATDDLIADITADQVGGEPVQADEDMTQDELEDKVMDLEDALDELKAEFAAMNGDDENGDDENGEPELDVEIDPEAEADPEAEIGFPAPEEEGIRRPFEGKKEIDDSKKSVDEHLKEYSQMVKADMTGDDDGGSKKSPVAGKNDMGGTSANIAKGGEEKGGNVSAPKADATKYANRAGGTAKSMSSPAPKPQDDKGDASAKSPVGPGK